MTSLELNATPQRQIPWWLKASFTAFVAVLVPKYWMDYGPTNFLYFCDVALLMTLVALWREDRLWASMPAVGILLPQSLWILDFLCESAGWKLTGMTGYMFDPGIPLFTRGLSFFHFWLPLLLLWLVWRLGYDRRALASWTVLAWGLLVVCFLFLPAPPAPTENPNLPVNVNYVYGMSSQTPQTWLPSYVYFALLLLVLPLLIYLPTHWVLVRWFSRRSS